MNKHEIPCESVWLDIGHTEKMKFFTWDKENFPKPRRMLKNLVKHGRKLFTIIDP
jgi:alpha-glucosidase